MDIMIYTYHDLYHKVTVLMYRFLNMAKYLCTLWNKKGIKIGAGLIKCDLMLQVCDCVCVCVCVLVCVCDCDYAIQHHTSHETSNCHLQFNPLARSRF